MECKLGQFGRSSVLLWVSTCAFFMPAVMAVEANSSADMLYAKHCSNCHGLNLRGSAHGVSLKGDEFLKKWQLAAAPESNAALLAYNMANMPPGGSTLRRAEQVQILKHIRAGNGLRGDLPLLAESEQELAKSESDEALNSWSSVEGIAAMAKSRSAFVNRELDSWRPVTQQLLNEPPPGDWLSWRRTLDGQGYTPLAQIKRSNVDELQLAWVIAMRDGSNRLRPWCMMALCSWLTRVMLCKHLTRRQES